MKILKRIDGDESPLHHLGPDFFRIFKYYRDYGPSFQYAAAEYYDRCSYRCVYCITESQGKTRMRGVSQADEFEAQFDKEVSVLDDRWVICLGAACDPYSELEPELGLTRRALEVLRRHKLRFTVTTKSPTIVRDLDIFRSIDPSVWYKIIFSFSSFDQAQTDRVELYSPPVEERIQALLTLYEAGLPEVWAGVMPWIPGVTDLEAIFERLPAGMPVVVQPLDVGEEFEEPLDRKSTKFSSKATLGRHWTFNEINAAYVADCNRLYDRYIGKFPRMEWRWPIFKDTHGNDRGYFRHLKPGKFKPEDFLDNDAGEPATAQRIEAVSQ